MVETRSRDWIPDLMSLARRAGSAIVDIRQSGPEVCRKADQSPVTRADTESEQIILAGLQKISPAIPVVSEEREAPQWKIRRQWPLLWLVDPLDGTREFVAGRDDFTVNIALIEEHRPVLGLIYQPVSGQMTVACQAGAGDEWVCFSESGPGQKRDNLRASPSFPPDPATLRVAVSHRYGDNDIEYLPAKLKALFPRIDIIRAGSSLKFCLLAAGEADFYVRRAPTCEWDTAAGQAILQAVGGGLCDFGGAPLRYNRGESLINPGFYAYGARLAGVQWG